MEPYLRAPVLSCNRDRTVGAKQLLASDHLVRFKFADASSSVRKGAYYARAPLPHIMGLSKSALPDRLPALGRAKSQALASPPGPGGNHVVPKAVPESLGTDLLRGKGRAACLASDAGEHYNRTGIRVVLMSRRHINPEPPISSRGCGWPQGHRPYLPLRLNTSPSHECGLQSFCPLISDLRKKAIEASMRNFHCGRDLLSPAKAYRTPDGG
jgi:hypothetical protein